MKISKLFVLGIAFILVAVTGLWVVHAQTTSLPSITSVTPFPSTLMSMGVTVPATLIIPGKTIRVDGTNFGDETSRIVLDDGPAMLGAGYPNYVATGPSYLFFDIPTTISVGVHTIRLQKGSVLSNAVSFNVVADPTPIVTSISPASAHIGDTITIAGSNFATNSNVVLEGFYGAFGETAVVQSNTSITFKFSLGVCTDVYGLPGLVREVFVNSVGSDGVSRYGKSPIKLASLDPCNAGMPAVPVGGGAVGAGNAGSTGGGFSLPVNSTTWVMGSSQTITWKQTAEAGGVTTPSATLWLCGPLHGPSSPNPFDIENDPSDKCMGIGNTHETSFSLGMVVRDIGVVPNTGSYTWNSVGTIADGSTIPAGIYQLKMYVNQNRYIVYPLNIVSSTGASVPVYPRVIESGVGNPTVTMTSPTIFENNDWNLRKPFSWASGSTQTIRWQTTGLSSDAKGSIFIMQSSSRGINDYYLVAGNVPNTGSYVWSSVGAVYGLDPNRDTSIFNSCNAGVLAPLSCFTTATTIPPTKGMQLDYNPNPSMTIRFTYNYPDSTLGTTVIGGGTSSFLIGAVGSISSPYTPPSPLTTCSPGFTAASGGLCVNSSMEAQTSPVILPTAQALQQQLVQLITTLLQLVQQAAARGLLSVDQLTSILSSIQIPH